MPTIRISERDADALARTAMSEVGHFGKYGEPTLRGGVEAVVDTIINRVVHTGFPNTIEAVVNAPYQFSAIGAPGGSGTWERLRAARPEVTAIVKRHLTERANGKSCTVEGAKHFLNPHLSSRKALQQWGNHVVRNAIKVWGRGTDIHYHGYAPGERPPPPYVFVYGSMSCDFNGRGVAQDRELVVADAGFARFDMEPMEDVTPIAQEADLATLAPAYDMAGYDAVTQTSDYDATAFTPEGDISQQIRAYKVERLSASDLDDLQDALNTFAEEGWRLRQILPDKKDLLLVLEGLRPVDWDDESDDSVGAAAIGGLSGVLQEGGHDALEALLAPRAPDSTSFDKAAFTEMFASLNLKYFTPEEFLVLGGHHYSGRCKGLNTAPPRALWRNILPTARVLDILREKLGAPIRTLSVYRSPKYNACLEGAAKGSMHMKFMAVDFACDDAKGPVHWAKTLKALRDAGVFKGGIGVYPTFVHVDTRGQNANFGSWRDRVF